MALLLIGSLTAGAAGSLPPAIDEYNFKAALLFNLAKFVEWPPEAFRSPHDPIVGCTLGDSPLAAVLDQTVNGKPIDDRVLLIRHIPDMRQTGGCHILFVSTSERKRWRSIISQVAVSSILTVGESEGFASEGGIVNFKIEGQKVRIEINLEAAARGRLHISAKLLSLAEIVRNR
jgi:hypothetical protein